MNDVIATLNNVDSDAHAFRVTMNLTGHSQCCPDDLKEVITKLIEEYEWDRRKLTPIELEVIYANMDAQLAADVLEEWDVESLRMRDWGFPWWREDHHEWWDGHSRSVDCRLCGHRDNRYEFPLVNRVNGAEIWTGSTCIVKFGVTVDGDGCAETAIAALRAQMGLSKKAQKRAEWVAEHPDAEEMIALVEEALPIANRRWIPWQVRQAVDDYGHRILPNNFESQRRLFGKWARATVKYFHKNGMLTPKRTHELWEMTSEVTEADGSVSRTWAAGDNARVAKWIVAKWEAATQHDPRAKAERYWADFARKNPVMTDFQREQVASFGRCGYRPDDLRPWNVRVVREIQAANGGAKPVATAETKAAEEEKKAKLAKLPW